MLGPCAPSTCIRHVGHIPCTLGLGPSGLSTQAATQEWGGPLRGAHRVAHGRAQTNYEAHHFRLKRLYPAPPTANSPHPGPGQRARLKTDGRAQSRLSGERLVCKHASIFPMHFNANNKECCDFDANNEKLIQFPCELEDTFHGPHGAISVQIIRN